MDLDNAARVSQAEFAQQTERRVPQSGDLIYSRELSFGWAVIVPEGCVLCMSQGMVLFRPSEEISPRFMQLCLNGPTGRSQATQAAGGSAHPHINLGAIKAYSFPLPSHDEQRQIVTEVDERLSQLTAAEQQIEAGLLRATRLRQSILKQAFEGKLVPQDPQDEPASVLLERLRAGRPVHEDNGKPAAPRRRAKSNQRKGNARE